MRKRWTFLSSALYCTATRGASYKRRDRFNASAATGPRLDFLLSYSRGALFDPARDRRIHASAARQAYWNILNVIHVPGALEAPSRCARGEGLFAGDANPEPGHPDGPERPRPARNRPDRHRQDRGLHAALA